MTQNSGMWCNSLFENRLQNILRDYTFAPLDSSFFLIEQFAVRFNP